MAEVWKGAFPHKSVSSSFGYNVFPFLLVVTNCPDDSTWGEQGLPSAHSSGAEKLSQHEL